MNLTIIHRIFKSALLLLFVPVFLFAQTSTKEIVYVGTYSVRGSEGIYVLEFNRTSGEFKIIQTITSRDSPNFLAIDPDGKFLFSANSQGLDQMPDWGSVSSYGIDKESGKLTLINVQPSYGKGACHVSVYPSGKWIFVSNYGEGNFSILPVSKEGKIGAASQRLQLKGSSIDLNRQTGPHTHSIIPSQDGNHLYVSDLGIDKVLIYKFNNVQGMVTPSSQPYLEVTKGAGPRHFAIHVNGDLAFLAEEISSTLNACRVNPNTGALTSYYRRSTLPDNFTEYNKVADIHLSADGNHIYVSNRGHNSIAIFDLSPETGQVKFRKTVPCGGETPRNFMIDPEGQFAMIANQNSDQVVFFQLTDQGDLKPMGKSVDIPSPVCVVMLHQK